MTSTDKQGSNGCPSYGCPMVAAGNDEPGREDGDHAQRGDKGDPRDPVYYQPQEGGENCGKGRDHRSEAQPAGHPFSTPKLMKAGEAIPENQHEANPGDIK